MIPPWNLGQHVEWSVHPPEAGLSLTESHPLGACVSMEIQCTVPVPLAGAEAEGERQKQQGLSSSRLLQIVRSQLLGKCQMGRSSAQPLLLAETFLVLEISLLLSSLEGREFTVMEYVVLWLFMKTAHHCPCFLEPKDMAGFQKEKDWMISLLLTTVPTKIRAV